MVKGGGGGDVGFVRTCQILLHPGGKRTLNNSVSRDSCGPTDSGAYSLGAYNLGAYSLSGD